MTSGSSRLSWGADRTVRYVVKVVVGSQSCIIGGVGGIGGIGGIGDEMRFLHISWKSDSFNIYKDRGA